MEVKDFLGYIDDAIGMWESRDGTVVVCFATPEVLRNLESICERDGSTLVLVNHQFFLDPFSSKGSKDMIASMELVATLSAPPKPSPTTWHKNRHGPVT